VNKYLYHWTTKKNIDDISKYGFKVKQKKQPKGKYVFGLARGELQSCKNPRDAIDKYEEFLLDKEAFYVLRLKKDDILKHGGRIEEGEEPLVKTDNMNMSNNFIEYDYLHGSHWSDIHRHKFNWKKLRRKK